MSNKNKNNAWEEKEDGWHRRDDAPPSKPTIDWGRRESVQNAREGVSDLRQKQNERNEEYKRKHGG